MSEATERAIAAADKAHPQTLEGLCEWLRIPSVSTDPERKPAMQSAAEWCAEQLRELNFGRVTVFATEGHPVVYGERLDGGPRAPTILYYGHYDVQPGEPLASWDTGPFEPVVRGDYLYARGASDMKGQVALFLAAVRAMIETAGRLPINVKCLIEGEEEIGSPHLAQFLREHAGLLACDLCLNGDVNILAPDSPALVYGLRGVVTFELRVHGPAHDRHSGTFGGAVENPAHVLARIIAGLHDAKGRVTLPGFYEAVREVAPDERAEMASIPQQDEWWLRASGAPALAGEHGYTALERTSIRPTLEVNGLLSGFTGTGSKTIVPAWAMAKLSARLVPDQTPGLVRRALEAHLREHVPPTVRWDLQFQAGCRPSVIDRTGPAVRAATRALEAVWGRKPCSLRIGGSIPVVAEIKEILGRDSLLMGFQLPDDNLHSPNERVHLPTFRRGVETYIRFFELLMEGRQTAE